MTDDRNPLDPNDPLDERLSAELDGATASGTPGAEPVDDARIDGRRRELASARDLLAIPPPPLDDVTRRRLLRTALAEIPGAKRRDLRVLNRVGVAAAVLAVVVAGGLMLNAIGDSDNAANTASRTADDKHSTGTTAEGSAGPGSADFGEVSDPQVLKRRVVAALPDAASGPTTGAPSTEFKPGDRDLANQYLARKLSFGGCEATVSVPAGVRPTVLGDATFEGAPAAVVVALDGDRTLIFVVARSDCRLLTSQFFGE